MNYTIIMNDGIDTAYCFESVKYVHVAENDYIVYAENDVILGAFPRNSVKALITSN